MTQLTLYLANSPGAMWPLIQVSRSRIWSHCVCGCDCARRDTLRIYCGHRSSSTYHFWSCHNTNNSSCVQISASPRTTPPISNSSPFFVLHICIWLILSPRPTMIRVDLFNHEAIWFTIGTCPHLLATVLSSGLFICNSAAVLFSFQTSPESVRFGPFQLSFPSQLLFVVRFSTVFPSLLILVKGTSSIRCKPCLLLV